MGNKIKTLKDVKEVIQAGFDSNEESLELFGKTYSTQLKAYLIEINDLTPKSAGCPDGNWKRLGDSIGWHINRGGNNPNSLFLDSTRKRVWIIYSIMEARESDLLIDNWVKKTKNIDKCWLTRSHLLHWDKIDSWNQRGIGVRFFDGLSSEDVAANFSLKAYYGVNYKIEGLSKILERAKENFVIHSIRWQKKVNSNLLISSEWYNFGKITINRAVDVDKVLLSVSEMANRYADSLKEATVLRDNSLCAFELVFSQNIDLDAFSNIVAKGSGEMKLWLIEIERDSDFRRFKGVDLHTWDRIFLDLGPNFAYLTIPGKGCVNAVPRIATIQGEDNAGKTLIYHNGVEVFV